MSEDAQMGIVRILRPYAGFETNYTLEAANKPIFFNEGGLALDPDAGNPGYSPFLMRGLSVVQGQRVSIWLPTIVANNLAGTILPYNFLFTWRYRNVYDFRNKPDRPPYSFPIQELGAADTTPVVGGTRVIIPAANQGIVFSEAEVGTTGGRAVFNVRANDVSPRQGNSPFILPPIVQTPAGVKSNGVIQQGLLDPNVFGNDVSQSLYTTYDLVALGDELLIAAYRDVASIANWDFAVTDRLFSDLFGNGTGTVYPNTGIYVTVGKAP